MPQRQKNNNIFSILPNIKVTKLSYIFVYKNIESKILWDFRNEIYKKFNKVISCRGEKLFEWKTTSSSLASASLTPLFLSVFLSIFRPFARLLLGALKFDFYCTIQSNKHWFLSLYINHHILVLRSFPSPKFKCYLQKSSSLPLNNVYGRTQTWKCYSTEILFQVFMATGQSIPITK